MCYLLCIKKAKKACMAPLALKDDLILVSFLKLASGYENTNLIYCNAVLSPFLCKNQSNHVISQVKSPLFI